MREYNIFVLRRGEIKNKVIQHEYQSSTMYRLDYVEPSTVGSYCYHNNLLDYPNHVACPLPLQIIHTTRLVIAF